MNLFLLAFIILFKLLSINSLNLKHQHIYRCNQPKGQYHIDFKLDPKSEYFLIEEVRKFNTDNEVHALEGAIEHAACLAVMTMPKKELLSGNIGEYTRLMVDPENKNRLIALQIRPGDQKGYLAVTKAEIKTGGEESSSSRKIKLDTQTIYTNLWTSGVTVDYLLLGEHSLEYIDELTKSMDDSEVKELEEHIKRAMRFTVHEMKKNGLIYKPQGTKINWELKDWRNCKEFKFEFTTVNGNRMMVKEIKISDI